jgi:hypothetical protein
MTLLRAASALLLSLLVPLASAQLFADFRVYPPGPTSETPVTITSVTTCFPNAQSTVEKSAGTITIVYTVQGPCPSPPFPFLVKTNVGTLEPGAYRLRYRIVNGGETVDTGITISVRNAASPVPFDIHPFAVRSNPAGLRVRVSLNGQSDLALCATPDCSDIAIRVGGVVATNIVRDAEGHSLFFDAPAHSPGLVDVVIEKSQPAVTWTYPAALLYFDEFDPSAFERILFPVLFDAPGAGGSLWRSEAAISNPNPYFVENFNTLEPIVCITYPCGERLAPGAYVRLNGGAWPHGVGLLVPRVEADELDFSLRVRDVSREAQGFGTEVPVVREKDLILDEPISLLEVPLDPRYRVKVRIYAWDPQESIDLPAIQVVNPETNAVKATHHVTLRSCGDQHTCATTPAYAELDLAPGAAGERVTLYVRMPAGAPAWAFATVTNNTTQQVTVVTPQ